MTCLMAGRVPGWQDDHSRERQYNGSLAEWITVRRRDANLLLKPHGVYEVRCDPSVPLVSVPRRSIEHGFRHAPDRKAITFPCRTSSPARTRA